MGERAFFDDEARRRTTETVQAIELRTSAEVVVTVRHRADAHRRAIVLAGAASGALVLAVTLLIPTVYPAVFMPLDAALGFALGALLAWRLPLLRRLFVPRPARRSATSAAARAAFAELGIEKTSGRTGLLVYAALFERDVELVPDVGLEGEALAAGLEAVRARLAEAVARRDLEAFLEALGSLAPLLESTHPRSEDDVNELCDAPV